MKIEDLYPYWPAAHDELVDRLRYISDELWNSSPLGSSSGSIRSIVYRFSQFERFWMQKIAQGRPLEVVHASDLHNRADTISEVEAVRATTTAYMRDFQPESLRSVRTAPGDPAANEVERNVPLSWIVWHVLEEELMTIGHVRAIIEQNAPRYPGRNR